MEKAYYLVQSGLLYDKLQKQLVKLETQIKEIFTEVKELSKDIGCSTKDILMKQGCLAGFVFDNPPTDKSLWRKIDINVYLPKQNSKFGRDIMKRFKRFKPLSLIAGMGSEHETKIVFDSMRCYFRSVAYDGLGHFILVIPYDELQKDEPELEDEIKNQVKRIKPSEYAEFFKKSKD